jgi:hypothetical protein
VRPVVVGDARAAVGDPLLNTAVIAVVGILAIAFLPWWRSPGSGAAGSGIGEAPMALTHALERRLLPGQRLFNAQPLGSWLEFALPQDRVFVDSRIEIYPSSVWNQYLAVSLGRSDWEAVLRRWRVDVIIASRRDQAWLIPQVRRADGWTRLYSDANYVAFRRA